ncbi:pollen receptor-like kinase 1 [Ipomoea triloba]|uniref:pollen receptor-like kinase 1 n=1 Tax=Ipomoea triloba TaxID=35885 RepID=UPI00125E4C89|nr:pollen receptor-like kinase 1 [Ipomoea triloba]
MYFPSKQNNPTQTPYPKPGSSLFRQRPPLDLCDGGSGGGQSKIGDRDSAGTLGGGLAALGAREKEKGKADAIAAGNGKHLVLFTKTPRSFDLDDLLKASAEVLGKGTFGTAYKIVLEMGLTMVVKRLRDVSVPENEFKEKIEEVGKMNNENLVPLRAYYYSRDEKLLVYDYIVMGSLSALLHVQRGSSQLNRVWDRGFGLGYFAEANARAREAFEEDDDGDEGRENEVRVDNQVPVMMRDGGDKDDSDDATSSLGDHQRSTTAYGGQGTSNTQIPTSYSQFGEYSPYTQFGMLHSLHQHFSIRVMRP